MPTYSTARFYAFPCSLSSGEYPLIAANQDLSGYLIASVPNVKHSKAIQQAIRVAEFTGFERVNMVEIDGLFYWTGSWTEEANGMMRYVLDLAAPTSFVRLNDAVTGIWSKTPTMTKPYMKESISNSMERVFQSVTLPNIEIPEGYNYPVVWIQQSGRLSNGTQTTVGTFSYIRPGTLEEEPGYLVFADDTGLKPYMPISELLRNIGAITGILAENTDDLSISFRAPFAMQYGNNWMRRNGYQPNKTYTIGSITYYMYEWDAEGTIGPEQTVTISAPTGQSSVWRSTGHAYIRGTTGSNLLEVPTYGQDSATVKMRTRADRSGIYTEISTVDSNGSIITTASIPEGHLPFAGNTWETYKAYQMEGDRQQMANAIEVNNRQQEIDQNVGIANATMDAMFTTAIAASNSSIWDLGSGAAVGAAAGVAQTALGTYISIWESEHVRDLKNDQARMDYELSQKRAIQQPVSSYQPGYGAVYGWTNYINPLALVYARPDGITTDYYNAWRANYGYASEGQQSLTAVAGFYQGKLLARSDLTGVYFDELNADFNKGFKFKVLS
jgi:hypothetical protein